MVSTYLIRIKFIYQFEVSVNKWLERAIAVREVSGSSLGRGERKTFAEVENLGTFWLRQLPQGCQKTVIPYT